MSQTVRSTESLWELPNTQVAQPLAGNISCDVCVVGAGFAGLTTAYLLCREGKRVVVLDSKPQVVRTRRSGPRCRGCQARRRQPR